MLELSPDAIALFINLAQSLDEADVRSQLEPILGDLQILPSRPWKEFPVRSVLALLLLRADQIQAAMTIALGSVSRTGPDEVAMAVITALRKKFYETATEALHHKRADLARAFLAANIKQFGTLLDATPERSLLSLMEFVAAAAAPSAPTHAPEGRATVINLGIWGERFIAAAEQTFLPCCLAAGNFPQLQRQGTVYLRIHTSAEDSATILRRPMVRALAQYAVLDVQVIPEPLLRGAHLFGRQFWNRFLIAALSYSDLMFARRIDADLMFGAADALLSNVAYAAVKRRLISGYRAVVIQPIRGIAGVVQKLLEEKGCRREDGSFDIPGDFLYRATLKAIHPFIVRSFMRRTPTQIPMDPVQFYFRTPTGFSLHTYQLSALGLTAKYVPADFACDYHTTDARLLSDLLIGCDRDAACFVEHANSGGYIVGLDEVGEATAFGDFEMSPAASVHAIQKWMAREEDIDHFLWAVRQQFDYPIPSDIHLDLPTDCRDEGATIAEIVALLKDSRPTILAELARYK